MASSGAPKDSKRPYAKTLLLPKTDFPMRADAANREKLYRKRTTEDLYRWQWNQRDRPLYVLQDGPPFANGKLHIGHSLNKILKDIIVRYKILRGHRVCYIPGWDCHGLPIEQKALQSLRADASTLEPAHIRKVARKLAEDAIETQKSEFQQFAITADWNHVYRTFDRDYEIRQLRAFQKMVERGLIYRASKPVLWSPSSRTALAEAEIDYRDDHVSTSAFVKFQVTRPSRSLEMLVDRAELAKDAPLCLSIWTTTPWTLPANMFVACGAEIDYALVHSAKHGHLLVASGRLANLREVMHDELRTIANLDGTALAGTTYQAPFHRKQDLPVILADYVTADSGTGLVHSAAGHGMEDYLAYKASLGSSAPGTHDIISPVDDRGAFTSDSTGRIDPSTLESLHGMKVIGEGSAKILEMLEGRQLLLGTAKIRHKYPYDWRTKLPVIVRTTPQWFADVGAIKAEALIRLADVTFTPPQGVNRMTAYVQDRAEWCISRQRAWGVPIPALYDAETDEALLDAASMDHIISVLEREGIDHWWSGSVEDFVPETFRDSGRKFRKGTDTIDVWFDSGTSWTGTQEFLKSEGYSNLSPMADVYIEGTDQHRGWFQSSLLTAVASESTSPYRNVITHGFVLDSKGVKMSKSVGNVVSPLTVVNGGPNKAKEPAYGADVLRMWAATSVYTTDVHLSNSIISNAAEGLRKIRNTMRFMLATAVTDAVRSDDVQLSPIDRIVLHDLFNLETEARAAYDSFTFHKAMSMVSAFCTNTLSSFYFETIKTILYADGLTSTRRQAVAYTLQKILDTLSSIVAPALPHLAEEVHENRLSGDYHPSLPGISVFQRGWVSADEKWHDEELAADFDKLHLLRKDVMSALEEARQAKRLGISTNADLVLTSEDSSSGVWACVNRYSSILSDFFVVSNVQLSCSQPISNEEHRPCLAQAACRTPYGNVRLSIHAADPASKCPRCDLYTRVTDETLCTDFVPETPEPEEHQYASAPSYKHVEQPLHSASTAEFDADGDEYHDGAGESEWAVYDEDETLRVDGDGREMSLDLDVKPEPSPVDIGQEIYRETAKPEPPQKLSANAVSHTSSSKATKATSHKRKHLHDSPNATPAPVFERPPSTAAKPQLHPTSIQGFFSTRSHPTNKAGFRYIPCGASPCYTFKHPICRVIPSPPYNVRFSWEDRSTYVYISGDACSIASEKGFRSARANVPLREGAWYFEVDIVKGIDSHSAPTSKEEASGPHVRVGISRREASLNAPVGFDGYSYGIRDKTGDKVHLSEPRSYGRSFVTGDTIGVYVYLPPRELPPLTAADKAYFKDPDDPSRIVRTRVSIFLKGYVYFEAAEYAASKEMEDLALSTRDPIAFAKLQKEAAAKKVAPPPGKRKAPTPPAAPPARPLPRMAGSKVAFLKNGEWQGVAYEDLFDWLPLRQHARDRAARMSANAAKSAKREAHHDDGTLGYYPTVSVFGGAMATLNPGPVFKHAPVIPKSEGLPAWRPLSERHAEYEAETLFYDEIDEVIAAEAIRKQPQVASQYAISQASVLPEGPPSGGSTPVRPGSPAGPDDTAYGYPDTRLPINAYGHVKKKTGLSREVLSEGPMSPEMRSDWGDSVAESALSMHDEDMKPAGTEAHESMDLD